MPRACRTEANGKKKKKKFLRLSTNLFSQLRLAVLQLIMHCDYIKMIMNKCITSLPFLDSLRIATRRNESNDCVLYPFLVSLGMTKGDTAGC